jgi:hypothetical protein
LKLQEILSQRDGETSLKSGSLKLCGVVGMVLGLHFSSHTMYLLRFAVLLLSNSFSVKVINYFFYRQKIPFLALLAGEVSGCSLKISGGSI